MSVSDHLSQHRKRLKFAPKAVEDSAYPRRRIKWASALSSTTPTPQLCRAGLAFRATLFNFPPVVVEGRRRFLLAKQKTTRSRLCRRLAPSAGCLRHSLREWRRQPRRVVFSRQQILSLLIKKRGAVNEAPGPAPSSSPAHRICRSPSSKIRTGGGRASCERSALARASRRRGLRPRDECAASGARFNLTLIRWWRIKNAAGAMHPLGQGSSRSVKTENDTLTPVQTAGAVCVAVSAVQWTAETAEACRFLPSANFVFTNQKNAAPSMNPLDPRRLHRSPRTASAGLHHQELGRAKRARRVRLTAHARASPGADCVRATSAP